MRLLTKVRSTPPPPRSTRRRSKDSFAPEMAAFAGLPRPLLFLALRALGSRAERAAPGSAGRSRPFPILFLFHRVVAAGGLLLHRPADSCLARAVPVECALWPRLVRLFLPPDGLDGPVPDGRALGRGRPARSPQARCGALEPRQDPQADRQACALARDRLVDRRRLGALFRRRADSGALARDASGADLGLCLDRHPDVHDLLSGRPHARAGLPLHVPVAAHPGGAHRFRTRST